MNNFIKLSFTIITILSLTSCLKEDDGIVPVAPLMGDTVNPEVGGAAEYNQVWIDLSANEDERMKINHRTDWDLGFYGGDEFRVIINSSILMAAAEISGATNIDAVTEADVAFVKSIIEPMSGFPADYIDDVSGNYLNDGTVIKEVSTIDAENSVYLLKMGYETYQGSIPAGSTYTAGDARGWKKIRILRSGNDYKLQYADVGASTHQEVIISKDADFHFSFFSIVNQQMADIQPPKQNWDLCFTVMNNVIEGHGTYIYADFVASNNLSNVGIYQIITEPSRLVETFNSFTADQIDESQFIYNDQRVIGDKWRILPGATVRGDRFYILKDPEGILFKLRFLSMADPTTGERGHPQFEYDPL